MSTTTKKHIEMFNPPHPGEVLRGLYLEPLGLTVTEASKRLGVSRKNLSGFLCGRVGVSPVMAIRLGLATNTTPESWLNKQIAYELWQAKERIKALQRVVRPLERAAA